VQKSGWLFSGTLGVLMAFVAFLVFGTFLAAGGGTGSEESDGSGGQLSQDGLGKRTVPGEYRVLIEKWGNLCDTLSPSLLAAQLYQESGFSPKVTSHANAQGIAQFIPTTWAVHGLDANRDGKRDPWDPQDAIPSAASYDCTLARNVKSVPGSRVSNMLAAYNAGPYRVINSQGVPNISETQNYVKVIKQLEKSFAAPASQRQPAEQQPGLAGRPAKQAGGGASSGGRAAPAFSPKAAGAIYYAQSKLGTPYLWGGEGRPEEGGRFDCSGLTQMSYASVGISLPRVADIQWYAGPHPTRSQLQPGDLVFFGRDLNNPKTIHHVGIYVGGGYMIHAPRTGTVIRFEKIDTQPDYFGATRVTQAGAQALPKQNDRGEVVAPDGPARAG
jgi:cell wall-associated NlpC family hydrolase